METDTVRVRFVSGVRVQGGAQYAAGEAAAFPAHQAQAFIALGLAERVPVPEPKAPASPPVDRMIRSPRTKGGV